MLVVRSPPLFSHIFITSEQRNSRSATFFFSYFLDVFFHSQPLHQKQIWKIARRWHFFSLPDGWVRASSLWGGTGGRQSSASRRWSCWLDASRKKTCWLCSVVCVCACAWHFKDARKWRALKLSSVAARQISVTAAAASNWLTANQRETWEATEALKTNLLSAETITDISHNKEARREITSQAFVLSSLQLHFLLVGRGWGVGHHAATVHLGFFIFFIFNFTP